MIKKIQFKNIKKDSTYYSIGGIRFYNKHKQIIPILFSTKDNFTKAQFHSEGQYANLSGEVSTSNSYGGNYYFIDSPFDTKKPQFPTKHQSNNYWLSSTADSIMIEFNEPVEIEKVEFIPYCESGTRKNRSIEVLIEKDDGEILYNEIIDTSNYIIDEVAEIILELPKEDLKFASEEWYYSVFQNLLYCSKNKENEGFPKMFLPINLLQDIDKLHNLDTQTEQPINTSLKEYLSSLGVIELLFCASNIERANIQTTHELNLLQDDLLQADKIQILNWFENEEDVNLQVFGELNNKFTSINKVINHEQVLKIVADSIGNAKFLVSEDKITWKKWNTVEWETVTFSHKDEIATLGMSKNALKDITKAQWEQLGHEFYLGVYLDKQTEIKNINYQTGIPNLTPEISNASLYILNTTATLDITLQGNKLYGAVTDDDKGKVQYRIILNGDPYLPDDGTFSPLEPEPQNINLRIPSDKLNIGGNNTIRIEFQDAWGSLDYWQTSFIGELNGLLFFDEQGELYSDELGEVIKPLDFGTIITGQMSLEHKIIFKNTLGQPVKDVKFFSDWGEYSPIAGVGYRFSLSDSPFAGYEVLKLERPVDHEEEVEIFVKMSTILGTTPETLGKVKFCVKATEIDDDEYQEILNNLS